MAKPFVGVVTGRPGSGKTTLAHALAAHIHCPALCRDEFKEGYLHTLGGTHALLGNDTNARLYQIFFETVNFIVAKGISIVVEAAFQHKLWADQLTYLSEIASVSVVVCTVDAALARTRWRSRALADAARERFHGDVAAASDGAHTSIATYEPPRMNLPTLFVNTTDGYDPALEHIAAFVTTDH